MASLERTLRKDLERAVKKARNVAEAGARQAIAQLGVGEAEAPKHLTAEQRALRNGLRAHGRQLGDRRDPKTGAQVTARLAQECAYEHWHRMLFARFLAETDLLIEPESGVSIALDEVQELAREKETDWLPLASDYAERMLPQIFRKDDPVLDIALPPETRSELEDLLKALPKAVFEADDSLGWVYQFWQAEKKKEINDAEVKIGADELPAVTQLFTEDYMVHFLLHNTFGAWWAGKVLAGNPDLARSAPSEEALRGACRVGDVDWTYLRFVRDKTEDGAEGPWRPAAGTFDGWPKAANDITVLDPCMGSGHFLVFALPILAAFHMAEEGLSERDAIDAVLRDNLFGLEIDPRCTQIAAFNLAFAAWKRVGFHVLPQLNLACSGLAIGVTKAEWLKLAEKAVMVTDPAAKRDLLGVEQNLLTHGLEERVKNGLEALYDLFAKAPWLGSLIDPRRAGGDIFREGFYKLEPLLASIMKAVDTDDAREMTVAAQGMAKAAKILSASFTLVATNVPYLGRAKHDATIKAYCEQEHPHAKADLATCFVERFALASGSPISVALVSPENWLFLQRYAKFRLSLLEDLRIEMLAGLGARAFEALSGEIVSVSLLVATHGSRENYHSIATIDVTKQPDVHSKLVALQNACLEQVHQGKQKKNPDHKILLTELPEFPLLSTVAQTAGGMCTFDSPRFYRCHFELPALEASWMPMQSTVSETSLSGGRHLAVLWEDGKGQLFELVECMRKDGYNSGIWAAGKQVWGQKGVLISLMGELTATPYDGVAFDNNSAVIVPNEAKNLEAIWHYCSSEQFNKDIRSIDRALKVTSATVGKIPFNTQRWSGQKYVEQESVKAINQPDQWTFDGHPKTSKHVLIVAVSRLLGFDWPRKQGLNLPSFPMLGPDGLEKFSDSDGIVCFAALKGEVSAEQRLAVVLAEAFGGEWSAAKLATLLADAGFPGKSLDDWLRDGFFAQHCELFHQRPFVWHIWDGRRDGFHALVNYHRLAAPNGEGRRTLEKLIYSYLGDWIDRQRADQKAGVEGADARLAHAEHLKTELIKILEGEPPYDIFVRWKPLHEQPIGWDPDINDGVRINIRPFMIARPLGAKAKGACTLRTTPKIKWDKDRGKEPTRDKVDYPWFWSEHQPADDFLGGEKFYGNRWNDLHYSRAAKQAARDRQAAEAGAKP